MFVSTERTAESAVAILAPFLPFLLRTKKSRSQNLADVIAEHGGPAAWDKAQAVWQTFERNLQDDIEEVQGLALGLAARPTDEGRRATFAALLIPLLKEQPQLTREIFEQLNGPMPNQQSLADHGNFIDSVEKQKKASTKNKNKDKQR